MKRLLSITLLVLSVTIIVVYYYYSAPVVIQTTHAPTATPPDTILPIKSPPSEAQTTTPKETEFTATGDSPPNEIYLEEEVVEQPKPFEYWHDAQAILRASYRPQDLVVAAMYDQVIDPDIGGNNFDLAEASLLRAYQIDASNELVNHQIMNYCSRRPSHTLCSLPYVDNLLQVDNENATLLNELSDYFYQYGDFNQALYLLNKAAVVPHSDNYYGRYIAAIDDALTYNHIRFMRTRENLDLYPRLAAANVHANYKNVIKMCDERIGLLLDQWRVACRDAGKNIADKSLDYLSQSYGVRQYVRYAGINLEAQQSAIRAVATERAKIVGRLQNVPNTYRNQIPFHVWEQFITDMKTKGEKSAYQNLEQKQSIYR